MNAIFLRFFVHSYCNQKMRIKWNAAISGSFDTSNGVKQGGVLSPLLFNVYLDELILLLREQGIGCHMNGIPLNNSHVTGALWFIFSALYQAPELCCLYSAQTEFIMRLPILRSLYGAVCTGPV